MLDVSDLLRSDAANELVLEHPAVAGRQVPVTIDDLRLERGPPGRAIRVVPPPDWSRPRLQSPRPPGFEAHAADATMLSVSWAGKTVGLRTAVTGGVHEWNRTLVLHPTHVEVRDTIRNPGQEAIGLHIRHALLTDAEWIHLAGRSDVAVIQAYAPWNPTVFTPVGTAGLGLVAEDDVLRQQLYVDFDPANSTAGFGTDLFCLGPGERHTLVWSVYPTRTDNYWDFINTVRDDWGVNKTIAGSFIWFTPDDTLAIPEDRLQARLKRQGVAIAAMSGGWVDPRRPERPPLIGFGTYVLSDVFADFRERLRAAIARLKAARPGIRCLVYFDAQRDSWPDAAERYADSVFVAPGQSIRSTDFGGAFSRSWEMVPTVDNSYGRALAAVPSDMAALGADGLYWDEMDAVDYEMPRLTEGIWDHRTCELDAGGRVTRRLGLTNLLSDAAKLAYADGRFVLGNSPPTTRRFQARPDLRMVEAHHGAGWGVFGHLTDPLGYIGKQRTEWGAVLELLDEGLLVAGTRLDYSYDAPARMFPFTPEYIQPGTLRGRERILTVRSGTHGWVHATGEVTTFRYDASGHEHLARWRIKRRAGGIFVRVRLAPGEMAVIERRAGS